MNSLNSFLVLGLILAGACFLSSTATTNPDANKGELRPLPISDDDEDHLDRELRQADDTPLVGDEDDSKASSANSESNTDTSKGRLFLKKFLLFRNLFNANTQPVVPIIITGAGTTGTSPTTITSPATITTPTTVGTSPTTSGTLTTINTNPTTNANNGGAAGRIQSVDASEVPDAPQVPENVNVQALQAALVAAAQEYVVTDQEIKGTLNSKTTRPPGISLRRKGAKRGQIVQVRIPPKYRQFFKSGQKVMLKTQNRQNKRRFVRKKLNKNRRRGNNNQNRNPIG